ncbi:unnamed protein product [Arabidopsis lyrata]|uniref:VQ domain-containing protein n=1 Tax=Arabidopsis lyrata subsp. lyrata TaxID=81972 RepID=D7LVJ0_ARALL|nr:sigma factor binding protein 1, chloroplastic [Arabidopsis lyrata subsp. lyrata]EFH54363.1 hypothetical protein ARALYDRAFT_486111 [Arabidopsis lyrata subsp. lyrata]CAH8268849.1 unnamed protein product [Arabidopsis lyrata]|eukprot:XP_002878104.1 sigma factor binding protein 1, chloroplastic [Arabidopsis lyrata subsp. lyrata]
METSSSTFLTTTSLDKRKPSPVSRKSPKQKKKTTSTNKPIKVRYISNPMRVQTCASKFRELVQELTGQDAVDLQPEPIYSPSSDDHNLSPPPFTAENLEPRVLHQEPFDERVGDCYVPPLNGEEMFLPDQMSAGFSGFFSNAFYNVNDFGSIDSI